MRQSEVKNYSNVVESAYVFARKVALFQGAFLGSSYLVGNTALLGTLVVGATFVIDGNMTVGELTGFCMFAGHLAESVLEISESVGGFLRAQGSGARLFYLLDRDSFDVRDATTRVDGGETLPISYRADIEFDDISFRYPSRSESPLVLDELSFKLQEGEMLAITGSSGSGKSSVMSLLMKFYAPTSGSIKLGGKGEFMQYYDLPSYLVAEQKHLAALTICSCAMIIYATDINDLVSRYYVHDDSNIILLFCALQINL